MPEIAFLLYEDMTALDAVGPYEVLARLPDADVKFRRLDAGAGQDRRRGGAGRRLAA